MITALSMNDAVILKDRLIAALSVAPGVREITTFGSFASGTNDECSDIDMLVCATAPFNGMPVLPEIGDVLYYKPFSATRYPCGRYWFKGYSVFHKVDISFHPPDEYAAIVPDGDPKTYKMPPFVIEWTNPDADVNTEPFVLGNPYVFSDEETEIGTLVYKISLCVKAHHRGVPCKYGFDGIRQQLRTMWDANKGRTWSGGELGVLVEEVLGMADEIPTTGTGFRG